jgi:DNA-binding transcriptional MerR regulator
MTQNDVIEPDLFGGSIPLPVAVRVPTTRSRAIKDHDTPKKEDAFKTISEAADMLSLPQHVLRFWESKFAILKPLKLKGGRRYYRPQDVDALFTIKQLLYKEGYTIKGARRALAQQRQQPAANRKEKAASMPKEKPMFGKKSQRECMDDAPLFQGLVPAAMKAPEAPAPATESPAPGRKDDLKQIHGELLQLRDLIKGLPSL